MLITQTGDRTAPSESWRSPGVWPTGGIVDTQQLYPPIDRLPGSSPLSLARAAQARLACTNADVIEGDATELPFPDESFRGVVSFTMLHHIPSVELQDRMLREVHRVLKPQGTFLATDNLSNFVMKLVHIGDTMVLVDPRTVRGRLEAAGFGDVSVETGSYMFRVVARRTNGLTESARLEDASRADTTTSENGRERASIVEAAPIVR